MKTNIVVSTQLTFSDKTERKATIDTLLLARTFANMSVVFNYDGKFITKDCAIVKKHLNAAITILRKSNSLTYTLTSVQVGAIGKALEFVSVCAANLQVGRPLFAGVSREHSAMVCDEQVETPSITDAVHNHKTVRPVYIKS